MIPVRPLYILLTVGGIGILLYGLYQAYILRNVLGDGSLKEAWDALSILIGTFIVGYTGYLFVLVFDIQIDPHLLISVMFFLGSMFVAIAAYTNKNALTP